MNFKGLKYSLFFFICLMLIVGAVSAADDSIDNSISVDAISEDANDLSAVSDIQTNYTIKEQNMEINDVEDASNSENMDSEATRATSVNADNWYKLYYYASASGTDYVINLNGTEYNPNVQIKFKNSATIIGTSNSYITAGTYTGVPFLNTNSALTITFKNVNFRNMQVSNLLQLSGTNILENCSFYNITAGTGHNAVVYNSQGTMNMVNCSITNSSAGYGVVSNYMMGSVTGVVMNIDNCKFINNYAGSEPGAINNCGILNVNNSEFTNNSAALWAGAIHTHSNAQTYIYNSNFTGNDAGWNGGALYTYSLLEVYNSVFKENKCHTSAGGGAIGCSNYGSTYNITISNCTFIDNENLCGNTNETPSTGTGGSISAMDNGILNVFDSTFVNNVAAFGQAIAAYSQGYVSPEGNITEGIPKVIVCNNNFTNHTLTSSDTVELSGDYTFENNTFNNCYQTNLGTNNIFNNPVTSLNIDLVDIAIVDLTIAEDASSVFVNLTDGEGNPIDGTIYIYLNGEMSEVNITGGEYVIPIDGNASVTVDYYNEDGSVSFDSVDVIVFNTSTEVPVNATISLASEDDKVVATLKDLDGNPIANAELVVSVNDVPVLGALTDEDGVYSLDVEANATVVISYFHDGASVSSSIVLVENNNTEIINNTVEVPVNATISLAIEEGMVVASLRDLDGNPIAKAGLVVSVNDMPILGALTDEDGVYSIDVEANATVVISYFHNGARVSSSIVLVENNNTEIINNTIYVSHNGVISLSTVDETSIMASLADNEGNAIANATIVAFVNGVESNLTTNDEGNAFIPVSGNTTVLASYMDENNLTVSSSIALTILNNTVEVPMNRTPTFFQYEDMETTAVVEKIDGRIGKYFVVVIKDENGTPIAGRDIQIGFNGKAYPRTTDENGSARLQINLGYKGLYTFAIGFLGDEYYNGAFAVSKITVKQQTPKLTTANKSYKASAKTKALTATFKTEKGNPIQGKKISFTVNGKTYSATTNAKGVATVKVSLNKKGTYSFTAKFAGNDQFNAVTKTAKLTIK